MKARWAKNFLILLTLMWTGVATTASGQTGSAAAAAAAAQAPAPAQPNVLPAAPAPAAVAATPAQAATAALRARVRAQRNRAPAQMVAPIERAPAQVPATIATPLAKPKRNANLSQNKPQQHITVSYAEAVKRQHRERHSSAWWKNRYTIIVFVTGRGYYYCDAGYWFPAWGYYPGYEYFDYDGPIYTYGELLPDQVIYNVQRALKELGYYSGGLTGSFSPALRGAIAAFQRDNDLEVTGAIDEPTVQALGLS